MNAAIDRSVVAKRPSLADFQREPARILSAGVTTLSWIVHEAEDSGDDLTFIACCNEIERRGEWRIFREEYMRLWPEHAKAKKYERA